MLVVVDQFDDRVDEFVVVEAFDRFDVAGDGEKYRACDRRLGVCGGVVAVDVDVVDPDDSGETVVICTLRRVVGGGVVAVDVDPDDSGEIVIISIRRLRRGGGLGVGDVDGVRGDAVTDGFLIAAEPYRLRCWWVRTLSDLS